MKLITILFFLLFVAPVYHDAPVPTPTPIPISTPQVKSEQVVQDYLVKRINEERTEAGLTNLRQNHILTASSYKRACDMNETRAWSHDGYADYIWGTGYQGTHIGENLARDWPSDGAVMSAWLNSPPHKNILFMPDYTEVGIGRCGSYVVAHFGNN